MDKRRKSSTYFSRIGFILSAAGSAVGLGNVYSFPSKVADHGGAAFVLVYLVLTALVVYPALVAEIALGRYTRTHLVGIYKKIPGASKGRFLGFLGIITIMAMLCFYAVVGGKLVNAFTLEAAACAGKFTVVHRWIDEHNFLAAAAGSIIFYIMTLGVIIAGVKKGIEACSSVLMPLLFILLFALAIYVLTALEGSQEGLRAYLVPDFSQVFKGELLLDALGQAFFSASLGVGVMIVYGAYLGEDQSVPKMAFWVLLCDFIVAFLAGLLVMPALFAARHTGINIVSHTGGFVSDDKVFDVLKALFHDPSHPHGHLLLSFFFLLMLIAALTSSISMLEVPVSYLVSSRKASRKLASCLVVLVCCAGSGMMIYIPEILDNTVLITTRYLQPSLSIMYCMLMGWWLPPYVVSQALQNRKSPSKRGLSFSLFLNACRYIIPLGIGLILLFSCFR